GKMRKSNAESRHRSRISTKCPKIPDSVRRLGRSKRLNSEAGMEALLIALGQHDDVGRAVGQVLNASAWDKHHAISGITASRIDAVTDPYPSRDRSAYQAECD